MLGSMDENRVRDFLNIRHCNQREGTVTRNELISTLRGFLETYIQDDEFDNSEDLFSQGLVSSLMAMQLVLFLEKKFALKFDGNDLHLDHFRSVEKMVDFMESKDVLESHA